MECFTLLAPLGLRNFDDFQVSCMVKIEAPIPQKLLVML